MWKGELGKANSSKVQGNQGKFWHYDYINTISYFILIQQCAIRSTVMTSSKDSPKPSRMAGYFTLGSFSFCRNLSKCKYSGESVSKPILVQNPAQNRNLFAMYKKEQGTGTDGMKWDRRILERQVSEVAGSDEVGPQDHRKDYDNFAVYQIWCRWSIKSRGGINRISCVLLDSFLLMWE